MLCAFCRLMKPDTLGAVELWTGLICMEVAPILHTISFLLFTSKFKTEKKATEQFLLRDDVWNKGLGSDRSKLYTK